jgi:hypothetical protein
MKLIYVVMSWGKGRGRRGEGEKGRRGDCGTKRRRDCLGNESVTKGSDYEHYGIKYV